MFLNFTLVDPSLVPIILKQNAADQTAMISDMGHTSEKKNKLDRVETDHRVRSLAEIWGIFMFQLLPFVTWIDHPNGGHLSPEEITYNTQKGHWEEPGC